MSQIGDGKVLLVDLNLEKGMAHPFYDGKPVVGVSEALDHPRRMREIEDSNLVLATANDSPASPLSKLPSALPRQFAGLVPRLKASDYDYIIFDLPPVDQTSITARVSSYMDLTLLVLESEKTRIDAAKQVTALLSDLKANVACVLNKTRKYVPAWLHDEL
jgi:Mrp family chromosome partitioning ATPase